MIGLQASLAKIDRTAPVAVPSDLQANPESLRDMVRIMNLTKPDVRQWQRRKVHEFSENDAQGIAYGFADVWFLSSQWNLFKYRISGADLYNPTSVSQVHKVGLTELIQQAGLHDDEYDHIGDVAWHDHLLFMTVRCTRLGRPHIILAVSQDLDLVGYCDLPTDVSNSCIAVNPWNGLGYIPDYYHHDRLRLYDLVEFYEVLQRHSRWRDRVNLRPASRPYYYLYAEDGQTRDHAESIQGLTFSNNGRLYIARYNKGFWGWDNFIQVYETMTGQRLGRREYDFPGTWDEIEGLTVHPSGVLYVAVADNDISTDEFEIHAIEYPNQSIPL